MDAPETITIASLASIIALGVLRFLFKTKGFKISCSSTDLFSFSAKVGSTSPVEESNKSPTLKSFSTTHNPRPPDIEI